MQKLLQFVFDILPFDAQTHLLFCLCTLSGLDCRHFLYVCKHFPKINSVISVTFIIGSLLAAIGSLLYFTNYQSIVPLSGSLPGLRAFVAAVFGGIGSIPGAVVGAFLIGICESVIKGSDWSVFSDAFTFALLIVVLCVKPTGLFGEKVTDKV